MLELVKLNLTNVKKGRKAEEHHSLSIKDPQSPIFWAIICGCSLISKSIYCRLNSMNLPNYIMNLSCNAFSFCSSQFFVFCFQLAGCYETTTAQLIYFYIFCGTISFAFKRSCKSVCKRRGFCSKLPTITSSFMLHPLHMALVM